MTFIIIIWSALAPVVIGPSHPANSNDTSTGSPATNYTSTTGLKPNKTVTINVAVSNPSTNDTDIHKVVQVSVTCRNVDVTFIKRAYWFHFKTIPQVNVNCGIVHVYMSYDNPHPSAALYSDKVTATDGHPAVLSLEKTVDGRPLYMTFVGTHLPTEAADLKNCSDAHFNTTIISVNESGRGKISANRFLSEQFAYTFEYHMFRDFWFSNNHRYVGICILGSEIICRQNGHERECTKTDFLLHEKYKHYLCSSTTGTCKCTIIQEI